MATYLMFATDTPGRNETVIAAGGAAAALAGLILVFLGAVITGMLAYPGGTPKRLLAPYRRATVAILAVFGLSLTSAALSLAWLATGGAGVRSTTPSYGPSFPCWSLSSWSRS